MLALAWAVYLGTLVLLGVYGLHRLSLVVRARASEFRTHPLDHMPVVTVQLPLFNEAAVAARVIEAAAALDWPRTHLEIQVLDDSTDDTRAICAAECARWRVGGTDLVHLHRTDRTGWKAGALEAGRLVARGELILVLDADFVVPPTFLQRTVGHFADPQVALVQARWGHLNREQSLLTRLQAMLLDGHFAVEQAGRAASGACFNFNGTAGLWRASAIASAGGWHHDTLTEDLDLTYRAALGGWHLVYAGDVIAPAELPSDLRAFKAQQHRWAKGSVECAKKLLPAVMRAPWPWWKKLEAFFHLTHNIPYLLTALLLVSGGICLGAGGGPGALQGATHLATAAITLGVLGSFVFASSTHGERTRALLRVPALIALTAGMAVSQAKAVLEALAGYRTAFVRTPKDGGVGKVPPTQRRRRYTVPPTWTRWIERAMAAYLAACCAIAAQRGALLETAMLALLASGALCVALPKKNEPDRSDRRA